MPLDTLSMGMSDDLEAAIMEGATHRAGRHGNLRRTGLHDMKITFIGGGNMAVALIGGMRRQGFSAAAIQVVEPFAESRDKLTETFGVRCTPTVDAAALNCEVPGAGGQAATAEGRRWRRSAASSARNWW
jgi:hypothetical protein